MIKKQKDETALVIVESPAKAKTIEKYLGDHFAVEASIGHIRDLPKGTKELPDNYKKESWARLGVNVDHNFEPVYIIPDDKVKQIKKLKSLLKGVDSLYLATDEDREGEAISWHLLEVLAPKVPVHRLVFHEITKQAITDALKHPRSINEDLVRAQETRRIIDRLYGYEISPLLWYKVRNNLSAGRVQSVAVRLIVDRERERMAFHEAIYWNILGKYAVPNQNDSTEAHQKAFQAALFSVGSRQIPTGKDFDPSNGQLLKPEKFLLLNQVQTNELIERLKNVTPLVDSVEEKPYTTRPYAPFTTSTLQQEANRKLGYTARITMRVAQSLYENGYITYMRTDSTHLSQEAIQAARNMVASHYGSQYLPASPRLYQTRVKNAQEAHEAIRPSGSSFVLPETLRGKLSQDEFRLYDLIWKRTVASQMTDAKGKRKTIIVTMDDARFQVSGKTIEFPGYLRAYVEGKDDPTAELADQEILLPDLKKGDVLSCNDLLPLEHKTMPPPRFSEAALTRTLEEKGIGRPSTYASIIDTILNRNYVFKKNGALIPTWTAFAVCQLLEVHFPELIDYQFTAEMENRLDAISRGELEHLDYLKEFYFGDSGNRDSSGEKKETPILNGEAKSRQTIQKTESNANDSIVQEQSQDQFKDQSLTRLTQLIGLKPLIENKVGEIDARRISQILIGTPIDSQTQEAKEPIYVRVGRYGPFLQMGEHQANLPEELPPDELTVQKALELIESSEKKEEPLGICPETGKPVYVKNGRFGPYVQRGETGAQEKPQNVSLLKGMTPETVDFQTALALLSLPKILGKNPDNGEDVIVSNGRFGPYVKCATETRSLSAELSPLDVDLEKALELLAKPKYGRSNGVKKSEPLLIFDVSPVTNKPVQLLNGRFGPYLTDGETNASLSRNINQEELTFEMAINILAERAAKGPAKKRGRTVRKTTKTAAKNSTSKTTTKTKKTTTKAKKSD
ncbi:MAG: type I DNA topoisomerase [Planctomycetia bacterium]|nr:type I DNA topoisomerase [Planctomycetia bacterium]